MSTTHEPSTDETDGTVIAFEGVDKQFGGRPALERMDFRIRSREVVAVVGVTGCGKSTTFNLILGLIRPTRGTVRVEGRDPYTDFSWFRGRMAVVFQDARLLPWRTALQNVIIGMKFADVPKAHWEERARDWLGRLGLSGREDAYPHQLSGGQRQRVSIARAFAIDPDLILCDESFSALDEITAGRLRQEFASLVRDNGKTGVVITHSIPEAIDVGDRIMVLRPPGHLADDIPVPRQRTGPESEDLRARVVRRMSGETEDAPGPDSGPADSAPEPAPSEPSR